MDSIDDKILTKIKKSDEGFALFYRRFSELWFSKSSGKNPEA
jgi:hypothetical protein